VTYSFTSAACFDKLKLDKNDYRRSVVKIMNPLGEDQSVMRTVMADSMLNCLSFNKRRNTESMTAYEFGRIYLPVAGKIQPEERQRLSIGMYGEGVDFFTIKGLVEDILSYHGISEYDVEVGGSSFLHQGRSCVIKINGELLAEIGEADGEVAQSYELNTRAYLADIDLQRVYDNEHLEKKYVPIPKFPAVYRDLAVTTSRMAPVGNMKKLIEKNKLVYKVDIFDVYEGKQVEKGNKSVAFSIEFRAADRTLSDKEVNAQFDKIVSALGEQYGAALRE
ncbi:MAG: phenylalanine--tRNA ligase subunit beta, partial [Clostridia bacterium]|nr:phenylalanine--tRNA ligase subunit beta [Clostridia bacterium]